MRHRCSWLAGIGLALAVMQAGGCEKKSAPIPPPRRAASPAAQPPSTAPGQRFPMGQVPTTAPAPVKETNVRPTPLPTAPPAMPSPPSGPPPGAVAPPLDPKVASFAGLTAPKPVTWIWHPPTQPQFTIAEYAVPGQNGFDQARIMVSQAGGTMEQNIERWKSQFRSADSKPIEPKIQKFEADGLPVTMVEIAGEYRGMSATSYTPDQLFLTAVVEAPSGQVFIRFVGPAGTVEPNRAAFMDMIRGLRKVEPQK